MYWEGEGDPCDHQGCIDLEMPTWNSRITQTYNTTIWLKGRHAMSQSLKILSPAGQDLGKAQDLFTQVVCGCRPCSWMKRVPAHGNYLPILFI